PRSPPEAEPPTSSGLHLQSTSCATDRRKRRDPGCIERNVATAAAVTMSLPSSRRDDLANASVSLAYEGYGTPQRRHHYKGYIGWIVGARLASPTLGLTEQI